jgi:hypothetical protein
MGIYRNTQNKKKYMPGTKFSTTSKPPGILIVIFFHRHLNTTHTKMKAASGILKMLHKMPSHFKTDFFQTTSL